jgi:hypothetical protein
MALDKTVGGANADTYEDATAFFAYATAQGLSYTADATAMEPHLRRAAAYLDRQYVFKGYRANATQARAWPRVVSDLDPDGYEIPSDEIPLAIIQAQFEIASIFERGTDLFAYTDGPEVKSETVEAGPAKVTTNYVSGSEDRARIVAIEGLLRGYILSGNSGRSSGNIRLVRG